MCPIFSIFNITHNIQNLIQPYIMRKIFLFVAILFAGFAWGADIKNFASGIENETIGFIAQDQCDAVAISTNAPRTGKQCLSTTFNGTGNRRWYLIPTFAIPKDSCMHIIAWTKLNSSDNTPASTSTRAYANVYAGGNKNGTPVNLTKSWQRITASSAKATVEKFGAKARFFRTHANKREVLFDDIIVYVSDNPEVDLTAPTPATSASATETAITWMCGTDANTGVKATLIWKRIDGTAEDLTLNNQGIYALTATDGPKVDQSGHWELVKILPPDATSYSESEPFGNKEDYAIVHRDLAYNYSNPTYVTTPDMSVKTLYLKPGTNWKSAGARFAIYCSEGDQWYDMEPIDAGKTVYKAEVSAQYTTLKFCRMKGDDPTNALTNPPLWTTTGDLTMPSTEAGAYVVPDDQWSGTWSTTPLSISISGNWLCFVGEQMTLTATSPGATHYQWYYKKHSTGDLLPISGATTATYVNYNFKYEDAGDYYCKSRIGTGAEITSGAFTVKTLRMYFNNAGVHGTAAYGSVDLKNTDPVNKKASGMIILGGPWEYGFNVTDGTGNYYGNNGQMTTSNHSNWPMEVKNNDCRISTPKAAFSTYTFVVNYSDMTKPVVTANYPEKNQQPGKVVYFDNSDVNWSNLHYRIGRGDRGIENHTQAAPIEKVPGTENLYRYTTPEYNGLDAWHIANNCGHVGGGNDFSIYKTTDDEYEVSNAIDYEGGAITQDITIVPKKDEHSAGADSYNNNCQFYKYTTLQGMKAHNVMIDAPEHGTITVSYTDVTNHSQSFTSGERELAHTCILTITATPPTTCGYTISLTVNGNPFTSGDTYILKERTTIDVEFEPITYNVTLNTNEGVILAGDVKEYIYGVGATLPTQLSQPGKDFVGWYDNVDLMGTPVTDIPATVCGDKEYWAKWVDERPRIAFIISGTPNSEDFDTYTASDVTACNSLVSYLRSEPYYFKIAFANGYATADETELAEYYEQFNLVVVTDFLDKVEYTDVIGTLIDQKPILSFETHVAGCPNWGISTTPKTPSTKQISITALCPEHQIFDPITASTDVVGFLKTTSGLGDAPLQGWTAVDAPKDMVFLATIDDGTGGNLVVCCERQKVMEARMMMMGLNHEAMGGISNDGKTIIRQIIEYLLQSDASDCTIVFDDKSGDHKWSNAANWAPRYNRLPKAEQAVRIDQPCEVDKEDAHCSRIRLRKDGSTVNGSLTILPTGGLTVIDYIKQMNGTDYQNTVPSAAGDLDILANTSGRNGSLVFGNTESDLQATVQYYSLAKDAKTENPVWQYIGIPISDQPKAYENYYGSWMCSWESTGNVSSTSNWVWVTTEDKVPAFKGYCITQEAATSYYHQGSLCRPEAISLPYYYFTSPDGNNGFNMFANSWVAPIDIEKIEESDFGDPTDADATIYIYNTGSRKQYEGSGGATDPGQFNVIPVHSSSYLPGVPTKIPTMQGFFIKANKAGTLTLDYKKICFDSDTYSTTAETMRAPRESDRPEVMQLIVSGEKYGDRVYLLAREDFSESFENGWDGRKIEGDENAPMLAVVKEAGDMAVAAIPSVEERELSFRAGSDTEYTFCFHYEGETIYLYDRLTGEATEIKTGNTYSFTAENKTAAKRFVITSNPPRVPTGIEDSEVSVQGSDAEKCIIDGQLYIIKNNRFYDARGVRVNSFKRKEVTL